VDFAIAGDEAVAFVDLLGHAKVGSAVADEGIELSERAFVEEEEDALTRGEAAAAALFFETFGTTTGEGIGAAAGEFRGGRAIFHQEPV
jgi:hypothetical protein